jgi:hypothetical protein
MASTRSWTVLVWMAGDNNLENFALKDLAELKRVGSNDAVAIAVQLDRMEDNRTRRYVVRKGGKAEDDQVKDLGATNTGDPAVATEFFSWGIEKFPSERVLAVMWNHGSGLDETDMYARRRSSRKAGSGKATAGASRGASAAPVSRRRVKDVTAKRFRRALFSTTVDAALHDRGIAYDDTAADFLDNAELKKVLDDVKSRTGKRIDLLGFDACLMNMIEVAFQCRDVADCIVGSQELEPGNGWPYDKVLADLVANPAMGAADLGKAVVKRYLESYDDDTITQSVLDMSRSQAAAKAVDVLAGELLDAIEDGGEYKGFKQATNNAQHFDTPGFLDLVDLCDQISARTGRQAVKDAAAAVVTAVSGPTGLVAGEGHEGSPVKRAHGVSIYVPMGSTTVAYDRLAFAKSTRWGKLLKAYTS